MGNRFIGDIAIGEEFNFCNVPNYANGCHFKWQISGFDFRRNVYPYRTRLYEVYLPRSKMKNRLESP